MKPVCAVVVLLSCINVSYTCPSGCNCADNIVNCNDKNLVEIPPGIPATAYRLQVFCCVENEGSDDFILEIFKLSRINNVEICCQQNNVSKHLKMYHMKMEVKTLSEICESICRSFSQFEDNKELLRNHTSINRRQWNG